MKLMNDSRLKRNKLGFLELVNKPSQEELNAYYANNYYQNENANYRKQYSELELDAINDRIALCETKISELRASQKEWENKTPKSLLDVGCGEGFVLKYFHKRGWKVAGIDFSRVGVDQMNPDCSKHVEQGDIFELLNAQIHLQNKHDLVWLGNVLEHVLDPIELLSSLKNVLNNDGFLVVTVPNDGNAYHEWLLENEKIPMRWWIAVPDHINYFTAETLKNTAEATGWDCLSMTANFPIDWFLAHEKSNYIYDTTNGPLAHHARLSIERIIADAGHAAANFFYESLAGIGLGRDITAYLRLR